MKIKYIHFQGSSNVLGPYLRSILWVQGCLKNCPGCIAPETHAREGLEEDVETILEWIHKHPEIEGITISGGEPFLQAEALCKLVKVIKEEDKGVIIYSGYTYQELKDKHDPYIDLLLGMTDLLIDGPYIEHLDQQEAGRGSSNQNYIFLTSRYMKDKEYFSDKRHAVIYTDKNKYIMEGIPSKEDKILFDAIVGRKQHGER